MPAYLLYLYWIHNLLALAATAPGAIIGAALYPLSMYVLIPLTYSITYTVSSKIYTLIRIADMSGQSKRD